MGAIRIAGLRFAYPSPLPNGRPVPALRGVDLQVDEGEFIALMGPTGAGKSTLCFALNGAIPQAIDGEFEGTVLICGQDTTHVPVGHLALSVGLVFEDVEAQLFNQTAADEIAFGLEAMGLPAGEIEQRIDQALDLVGLPGFRPRSPRTLSGGEQKRLALASVLAMRPQVLVLDEPTSGLDPRGRQDVIAAIDRLRLNGTERMTVVMATQDAEVAAQFADRVVVLEEGRVALAGSPERVFGQVERFDAWGLDVPQLARLSHALIERGVLPQESFFFRDREARQVRQAMAPLFPDHLPRPAATAQPAPLPEAADALISIHGLSHRYPGTAQPALQDVSLEVCRGQWLAVIGVNGSGKSTLIKHLNGLLKPTGGQVSVGGYDTRARQVGELARLVSYLPQNPDQMIFSATVRQEVAYGPRQFGLRGQALDDRVNQTLEVLNLGPYADHPPAVLSYGMRRKIALASALATHAPVLALDEPATGLDRGTILQLMEVISQRHSQGTTVIVITHDLQLAAQYAQRTAILYQGRLVTCGPPQEVLTDVPGLAAVGLAPTPVTALAYDLGWPEPMPLDVEGFMADRVWTT